MQPGPSAPASCGLRRRPVRDGSGTMAAGRESEPVHPTPGRSRRQVGAAGLSRQTAKRPCAVDVTRPDSESRRGLDHARERFADLRRKSDVRVGLRTALALEDALFAPLGEPLHPVRRGLDGNAERLVDAVGGLARGAEFVRLAAEFDSFVLGFHVVVSFVCNPLYIYYCVYPAGTTAKSYQQTWSSSNSAFVERFLSGVVPTQRSHRF